jgi:hypothetical protein
MHLHFARADASAVKIELDVGMFSQERHGNSAVGNSFGDHQRGQPLAKWIVVIACVPDRNFLGFPGFDRSHGNGSRWNASKVAPAGGASILDKRHRMQIDNARAELAIFRGGRGCFFVNTCAPGRIIEGPMFYFSLAALHEDAADIFPGIFVFQEIAAWEMEVRFGHDQVGTDAIEAEFAVGSFE